MNDGKKKLTVEKSVRRENRVAILENLPSRTAAENAELQGLYEKSSVFEEQYDAALFSPEHAEFKRQHNQAFGKLVEYIQSKSDTAEPVNVFFLDGPDAATTKSLLNDDETGIITIGQLFVANRHESTCEVLRETYWASHPSNVVHNSAADALYNEFRHIPFGAFYFDGCGGHVPMILEMIEAALLSPVVIMKNETRITMSSSHRPMVMGFSIMGGGRDIVEKETSVVQAVVQLAKTRNLQVRHVLDDPCHYGVDSSLSKLQGGTFTCWLVLE
ncbi:unnamed protein product [Cylindrotheca closterium]|uniref:Uncharacterized protein n=1 Tax=Cylindrotheca closterium TaxID=2856 RepID=A0AAD2G9N1_9STRA|nr:unnamed protein product [Cylindrotheca closterium]